MMLNLIDKIGDWNPQLLRELKGRLKFFNVAIAVATSLLLQLVVFLYQLRDFPGDEYWLHGTYCRLNKVYQQPEKQAFQNAEFNDLISKNIGSIPILPKGTGLTQKPCTNLFPWRSWRPWRFVISLLF